MKLLLKSVILFLVAVSMVNCKQKTKPEQNATPQADTLQVEAVESVSFQKTLSLQNITFEVSTTGEGSIRQMTVKTTGLTEGDEIIHEEIDGSVTDAEVEDLNADGSPELLIYVTSAGSGSYGTVFGYSVNNKKSISAIAFPDIMEEPQASKGYMGHDEFTVVETSLMRRFPVYNEGDTNADPTGGKRSIVYKLVDGEASRKFVIKQILN